MVAEKVEKSKLKAEIHRSKFETAMRSSLRILGFFAITVALSSGYLFAAEQEGVPPLARYRVFLLRHISAQQGKKYLTETKLGTVSQLPGSNALLVTADPHQLIKASAILQLVDANEPFVIKTICPVSEANSLPSNEEIAAQLRDISIGTFSEPPTGPTTARAVIDTHDDAVVVIATAKQMQRITSTIDQLQNRVPGPVSPPLGVLRSDPNESRDTRYPPPRLASGDAEAGEIRDTNESDELFNKLLGSIAQLEKETVKLQQLQTRPTKPAQPFIGSEPSQISPEQPQEPNLPDIVKGPVAEDAAENGTRDTGHETRIHVAEPVPETPALQKPPKVRSYEPEFISTSDETLELDLPEKLNIIDLFDLVGKYLHLDYMYDEKDLKDKEVSLRVQGPIKVKDLYPLLESVLKFRGFVMTRKGNLVTIVPEAKVLDIDPDLYTDAGMVEVGDIMITRIFELSYVDTTSANNLLNGMKLGVSITPIPETGTLIVTGYAYRMARIEELLTMIDKPGVPREFRFRQLKYTMAKTLAPKVKTLIEQMGTISITVARPAEKPPAITRRRGESAAAFKRRQAAARRAAAAKKPAAARPTAAKPTVYLDADERTNRILMIGNEDELDIIEQLIDTLDVAQQDLRTLRLYEIQHVGAEEVKAKLTELGIIGAGRTTTTPAVRAKPAAKPTTPGAAVEPLVEQPQVVIIESTNSLLVNATVEQHERIAHILAYVDCQTLEKDIPYEVYPLENQRPEDLAGVLNQLIKETIRDKEGKIQQTIKKTEEEISIIADENTFSLIVYASRKNQEWIRKLIKQLDKRRPQVLIDVSLVEITREDQFQYDLNIIANAEDLVTGNIGIKEAAGLPLSAARSIIEGGWNLRDSKGKNTSEVRGFYADDKIQALFTAIDKKDYGRVLAQPKILVNDNEEGVIKTTKKTHVKEETISWPGDPPHEVKSIKYVPYEARIELSITPNISEGDLLRLEINMLREDYEPKTDEPPDYTTSNVSTIVTVPDGSTIILGGLTKLKQKKAGSKVPLLGDIPIVGGLFRTISNSDEASKLYIFVKANILRPDETAEGLAQLRRISERDRAAFEDAERKFQAKEDWPGIKPEPMDPLHILEAE